MDDQSTTLPPDVRQLLLQTNGQEVMTFMEPGDVFDEHIVGAVTVNGQTVAVYSKPGVIAALASARGISIEEAFDALHIGMQQSLIDGPQMPLFMTDIRDL